MSDLDLTIRQVVDKYHLLKNKQRAKSLGQHFLCDASLLQKIALCAAPYGKCDIVEIGPGPCGLTRAILGLCDNTVFCIEKDEELEQLHMNIQKVFHERLTFVYADALGVKLQTITSNPIIIIANLPYNVGTQILLRWLGDLGAIQKMVLMFQKEVAERICAKVGTKEYGRLSIMAQLLCECEQLFDISSKAFYPAPKVESMLIKLTPKNLIDIEQVKIVDKLANLCFQQRRKTISSVLKKHYDKLTIESALNFCEIDQMARPETISPQKFLSLSAKLENNH